MWKTIKIIKNITFFRKKQVPAPVLGCKKTHWYFCFYSIWCESCLISPMNTFRLFPSVDRYMHVFGLLNFRIDVVPSINFIMVNYIYFVAEMIITLRNLMYYDCRNRWHLDILIVVFMNNPIIILNYGIFILEHLQNRVININRV